MSADTSDREQYSTWFATAARQARTGDREIAQHLIGEFAQLSTEPHAFDQIGGVPVALTQYIATCLADWQMRDFKDAETWFNVAREAHAPDQTTGQHVAAMRAYLLLLARAKGVELARAGAAMHSGLTESQVQYLVEKDKPEKATWFKGRAMGVIEAAALMGINKRLHHRVLNPPRKKYQRSR